MQFQTPDEATMAMSLDNSIFDGAQLAVRRPKDYEHSANEKVLGISTTSSLHQKDSPNRIFLCNIPTYLTDDQVKELMQAFGVVRSFQMIKDPSTGESKVCF